MCTFSLKFTKRLSSMRCLAETIVKMADTVGISAGGEEPPFLELKSDRIHSIFLVCISTSPAKKVYSICTDKTSDQNGYDEIFRPLKLV